MSGVATPRSDRVFDGTANASPLVKRVKVDLAASGDLVAAVVGKKIRVLGLMAKFASSTTLKLQSGASSDLTGAMTGTDFSWPVSPLGYCETVAGEKLNVVMGASVQLSGTLIYAEV